MGKKRENILLKNTVSFLIRTRQEGQYWDFKREWHTDNGDLVHDIICMANNLSTNDGLIIIGIDEENDYYPCGVNCDENKKNTQNIVDLLKDIHFAGDTRPFTYVETLWFGSKEIDVVIVKNDANTPYYLVQQFRKVHPYNIYTRVGDTNTPVDRSADIKNIEKLWKKRFGIDLSPLERVKNYLRYPAEWCPAGENDSVRYYRQFPEFTYEQEYLSDKKDIKFFFYGQTDYDPRWYSVKIKYHQTVLSELLLIGLDGSRLLAPAPELYGFSLDPYSSSWDITFDYYIENTLDYIIESEFLFNSNDCNIEKALIRNQYHKVIMVFKNKSDIELFIDYAIEKWITIHPEEYESMVPSIPDIKGYDMEVIRTQYLHGLILKDLLADFYNTLCVYEYS